jgi:hypothetical protein
LHDVFCTEDLSKMIQLSPRIGLYPVLNGLGGPLEAESDTFGISNFSAYLNNLSHTTEGFRMT